MSNRYDAVSSERIPRQVRNYKESILRKYYYFVFGDRFVRRFIPDESKVLDIGSGAGRSLTPLVRSNTDLVGIDLSPDAVQTATDYFPDKSASFTAGDATHLPFRANSFDAVQMIGFLSEVGDTKPVISECRRVLKPGGTLIYNLVNADTILSHKLSSAPGSHQLDSIIEATKSFGFNIDHVFPNFFITKQFKKAIFSQRIPILARWFSLFLSILGNEIFRNIPIIKNRGGLFWIICTLQNDCR